MYVDSSGHNPLLILAIVVIGVIGITAGAQAIEVGHLEAGVATSDPVAFKQEQEAAAAWNYQHSCARCHYASNVSITDAATHDPRPETPLGDLYTSGVTKMVNGTTSLVGGVSGLGSLPGLVPMPGTLSNVDARIWYLNQEKKIPGMLDPNWSKSSQASFAFEWRNYLRTRARELMADRTLANELMLGEPNLTWQQIIQKAKNKGFSGNDIYDYIISSSQRSRKSVNDKLIPK